jgi:amino acid transporter
MVVPLTWLNIRGAVSTGNAALFFAIVLLVPFLVMLALGIVPSAEHAGHIISPLTSPGISTTTAIGMGLFVIMWNYLGWDSISTISREMKDAPRIFPKALMIGLPLVVLFYLLPVFVGLNAVPDISKWTDGSWPTIASAVGGKWLGVAVGVGGLLSAAGLFIAGLLAASRIPFVLAADGYLPQGFTKLNKKHATPSRAIITSAALYLVLSGFSFEQLAEVDVLLYSAASLLEFLALIQLRRKQPELARPFRIPGGLTAVIIISGLPALLIAGATIQMLSKAWIETLSLFACAGITGIVLMRVKNRRNFVSPNS